MKTKTTKSLKKKKVGRPKIKLNYTLAKELAEIHCTQQEIADVLNVSTKTLQRDEEFCRLYKKGLMEAKQSLRRMQFKSANKGSVVMQIWLGKQYLGQSDKEQIETNNGSIDDLVRAIRESKARLKKE